MCVCVWGGGGGGGGGCVWVCGVAWYYMYVLGRVACKTCNVVVSIESNIIIYTPHSHTRTQVHWRTDSLAAAIRRYIKYTALYRSKKGC